MIFTNSITYMWTEGWRQLSYFQMMQNCICKTSYYIKHVCVYKNDIFSSTHAWQRAYLYIILLCWLSQHHPLFMGIYVLYEQSTVSKQFPWCFLVFLPGTYNMATMTSFCMKHLSAWRTRCPWTIFACIIGIDKEFMIIRCNHSIHVTADMIMLCLNSERIGPSLLDTSTSTSIQDKGA